MTVTAPALTIQDIQAKVLAVLTPDDRTMFQDLMARINQAMTADERQAMQNMGTPLLGALFGATSLGMNLNLPSTPVMADYVGPPVTDDFIAPGYNAITRDDAIEMVAEHLSGKHLESEHSPIPDLWPADLITTGVPFTPGPSLTRRNAPLVPLPVDGGGWGMNLTIDTPPGGKSPRMTFSIEPGWICGDVDVTGTTALIAGCTQRDPDHWLVGDGLTSYRVSKQDVDEYQARQEVEAEVNAAQATPLQGIGQGVANGYTSNSATYVGTSQYGGWSDYQNHLHPSLRDPADIIGGVDPDKVKMEELGRMERQLRVGQMKGNWKILNNTQVGTQSAFMATKAAQAIMPPNLLTGVPDLLPEEVQDVQVNMDAIQDLANVHREDFAQDALIAALANAPVPVIVAPPVVRMTDTYTPARPLDMTWSFSDLRAECRAVYEFTISHVHSLDSEMAYSMLAMIELFDQYTPRTPDEWAEATDMMVVRLMAAHAVLAVATPLPSSFQNMPSIPSNAQLMAQVQAAAAQVSVTGATINGVPAQGIQAYIPSANVTNPQLGGVYTGLAPSGANNAPWPFMGAGENPSYDRQFKLLPNHVYLLEDGSKIEVDGVGNYTIHDDEGKVTYRATRMREFNRYVNGSDLIGEFIESLGELGASQNQAAIAPIEMFIRWLIFKAAEHDREEPPEDVPPLTAAEIPADPRPITITADDRVLVSA